MKQIYIILLFIISFTALISLKNVALADNRYKAAIPKSGDLCGGTGGNGQIIGIGNNVLSLKRNDGKIQLIHLTNQAEIKTSAGNISLSGLKVGERVTLVGGPNPDGSFNADTVVLCSGTAKNIPAYQIQSGHNKAISTNKANAWSWYLNASAMVLITVIWIGMFTFHRLKRKKSLVHLLFFTIFYIYIVTVLDYTLFQFQSLLLLKLFAPNIMLNGVAAGKRLNLIPLVTLTQKDIKTSLLNILLFIPFGFGLPFNTGFRMKRVVITGALFSLSIELLQLLTGLIAQMTFRIADINDVIFNTFGVAIGYILFVEFIHLFRHVFHNWKISTHPLLRYIAERPQVNKQPR